MNFDQAEVTANQKVVHIPFHNQHAGVVRLIKTFGFHFIGILKTLMSEVGTIVSYTPEGNPLPTPSTTEGEITFDQFIDLMRQHREHYQNTQLKYLTPIDFSIQGEEVSLVCLYHELGNDEAIPEHIKLVYNNPPELIERLISKSEEDLTNLWDFAPIAFIAPLNGSYV